MCWRRGVRRRGSGPGGSRSITRVITRWWSRCAKQLLAVRVAPRAGRVPFYSAVTGTVVDTTGLDAGYWWRNLREQVKFARGGGGGAGGRVRGGDLRIRCWCPGSRGAGRSARCVVTTAASGACWPLLAEAWTHGAAVDWTRLITGGRPVTLPTYPFQHRRYWASGGGTGRGGAGHPLLDSAVRLAEDAGWVLSGRVSAGTSPWLADHAVRGRCWYPARRWRSWCCTPGTGPGCRRSRRSPSSSRWCSTAARSMCRCRWRAEQAGVFSRTGEQWTRHATATLADPAGTVAGLDGQWPPAGAQALPVSDAYDGHGGSRV